MAAVVKIIAENSVMMRGDCYLRDVLPQGVAILTDKVENARHFASSKEALATWETCHGLSQYAIELEYVEDRKG